MADTSCERCERTLYCLFYTWNIKSIHITWRQNLCSVPLRLEILKWCFSDIYIYLEVEKFQGLVFKKLEDISFIKESEHANWKKWSKTRHYSYQQCKSGGWLWTNFKMHMALYSRLNVIQIIVANQDVLRMKQQIKMF